MKISRAKDMVLKSMIEDYPMLKTVVDKLDDYTLNAAIEELKNEGYIQASNTTVSGHGKRIVYAVQYVHPKGQHFYRSGQRFRKKEVWKWLEEAPKRYWPLAALFAVIAFALPLYLQYCNRPN